MNRLYLDELNLFSLLRLVRLRGRLSEVYYFSADGMMDRLLPVIRAVLLKGIGVYPLSFHLGDIHAGRADGRFEQVIVDDVTDLCGRIETEKFSSMPLLEMFARRFGRAEISLYLKKKMYRTIQQYAAMIDVVRWHVRSAGVVKPPPGRFLISHYYADALRTFAARRYVTCASYAHPGRAIRRITRAFGRLLWPVLSFQGLMGRPPAPPRDLPLIGCTFMGRGTSFDPAVRSDLFWLVPPHVPRSRVMFCFDRTDMPATADVIDQLDAAGVRYIALKPGTAHDPRVPLYRPGWRSLWICLTWNIRIFSELLASAVRGRPASSFYVDLLLSFIRHYAWWSDFVRVLGIRVHIQNNDFADDAVPFHLALRHANAVSVGYQLSVIHGPNILIAACRDVYFAFGADAASELARAHSIVGAMHCNGYITDQSFDASRPRALEWRNRLKSAGASIIVCFFDENSTDRGIYLVSHRSMERVYRRLFEAVLSETQLGLIVKPKHPQTLFRRLPGVKSIAEAAIQTGRCLFLDQGRHLTDSMPAEAALASDVAVGLMGAGTAALESYLAGVPTVLLDVGELYRADECRWPPGVVYGSWDQLWPDILAYHASPSDHPRFGDLATDKDRLDPFRDGRAAFRIGQYLAWLLESLDAGLDSAAALASADRNYGRTWPAFRQLSQAPDIAFETSVHG